MAPRTLGAGVSRAFDRIAGESEELAREYEPLAAALERVYASGVIAINDEQSAVQDDQAEDADYKRPFVDVEDNDRLDAYGTDDFAGAPGRLQERLRRNRREVQAINNELSLVIEEDHGRLLNFGDIEAWGLNELLRRDVLRGCYDTILAPHHGTQVPGKRMSTAFPSSTQVIAQNGERHLTRMKALALGAHTWRLISTAVEGTAVIYPRCHCFLHGPGR